MTKNVTLRLDEELLKELRHRAVDADMSLSAWITTTLKGFAAAHKEIEDARIRSIERMERGFHLGGQRIHRDQLHAR